MPHYLVTGAAGFIGFHLVWRLLKDGNEVTGLDNLNNYYEVDLKLDRLKILQEYQAFTFHKASLEDSQAVEGIFNSCKFDAVLHLAAQAGVRYSLENPIVYIDSNITGFLNILEACRHHKAGHLVFASSSSVYGANTMVPYSVRDNVDHPLSLYAATKKSNELMAHTYSHLFGLPVTGLRFFTVYGPWGRPDMAPFLFTKAIFENKPVKVFNYGNMERDFTFIDDIIESIVRLINKIPQPDEKGADGAPYPGTSRTAAYRIYNIGNSKPVRLEEFISVLEDKTGIKAVKEYFPMQPGDVPATYADIDDLVRNTGFRPLISIQEGVGRFVQWYREYYKV